MNEDLSLKFPLFTLAGREEKSSGFSDFVETVPKPDRIYSKLKSGNKPTWVKSIPKVEVTWVPIVPDKEFIIFDSQESAKFIIHQNRLNVTFGEVDIIRLADVEEVKNWLAKSGCDKIRFYIMRDGELGTTSIPSTII